MYCEACGYHNANTVAIWPKSIGAYYTLCPACHRDLVFSDEFREHAATLNYFWAQYDAYFGTGKADENCAMMREYEESCLEAIKMLDQWEANWPARQPKENTEADDVDN